MRYSVRLLLLSALLCITDSTWAQAPKMRFLDLPAGDKPLSGRIKLHIGVEAGGQEDTRAAIYVDETTLLVCYVPCNYTWDTRKVANGTHVLHLRWIDPADQSEHEVASATVRVDNREALPDAPGKVPGKASESTHPLDPRPAARRLITRMHPQEQQAQTFAATKPLSSLASALHVVGKTLYIGLPDGGVTVYDRAKGKATTVHANQTAGRTQTIFTGEGIVWWLAEDDPGTTTTEPSGARYRAESPARWLFAYREQAGTVTAYDLQEGDIYGKLRRCACWQGQVALFADTNGGLLDPQTGEVLGLEVALPDQVLGSVQNPTTLYMAADEQGTLLVSIDTQPHRDPASADGRAVLRVMAWRGQGQGWRSAGTYNLPVEEGNAYTMFALTPEHLFMRRNGILTDVPLNGKDGQVTTLPASSMTGANNEKILAGDGHCWMLEGSALFHAEPAKQSQERLLPWNEPGLETRAAVADKDGIWLATNRDVRFLSLTKPDPQKGYNGFIRVPLGEATTRPTTDAERKLAGLVAEWQGVPYKWGGSEKTGTDCSGFVMSVHQTLGISLPHGTEYLRTCSKGPVVHDTLRYGDVLVYPGHCAIYLGDGKTAETVDAAVSYASIWGRRDVVVRRFINAPKPEPRRNSSGTKKRGKKS